MNKRIYQLQRGVSMFELIIAVFIITIILTSVAVLATSAIRNNTFATNKTRANNYAQEGMDWLRGLRDNSYSSFASKANDLGMTWCIDTLGADLVTQGNCLASQVIPNTTFIREAKLTSDVSDPDSIEAVVSVSWNDAQGVHSVKVISSFTNWTFLP